MFYPHVPTSSHLSTLFPLKPPTLHLIFSHPGHHAPTPPSPVDPAAHFHPRLSPWSSNVTCDLPPDAKVSSQLPSPSSWPSDLAAPGTTLPDQAGLASSPQPIGARRHSSGLRRSSSLILSPSSSHDMYRPLPEAPPHPSVHLTRVDHAHSRLRPPVPGFAPVVQVKYN